MFNHHDITRDAFMLRGPLAHHGYDWWWHSFTAQDTETGEDRPFFIEFFVCNPALAENQPVLGQLPENQAAGKKPSYLMVKAGTWGENACQLHRFFSLKDVTLHPDAPYRIEAADCLACETALKGSAAVAELGKDIGMQAAAMRPLFMDKSDVDQATLDREKEILLIQATEENKTAAKPKPQQIIEKMVMGRIGKYYEENCLLQQAFVKENKVSVEKHIAAVAKELGGTIKLVKYTRFEKGEGIEKKQDDFAAEVASMAK